MNKTREIEVWVEVEHKGRKLFASTLGRIKSPARTVYFNNESGTTVARPYPEKIISGSVSKSGYIKIGYGFGSSKSTVNAHTVIAKAFLGDRPNGSVINHKNGIKTDNRPENLEYVTPSENIQHAFDNDLNKSKGVNHHNSVLTSEQVSYIRDNLGKLTQREIAKNCGVGEHIVSNIKLGKTYLPSEKEIKLTESQFDEVFDFGVATPENVTFNIPAIKRRLFGEANAP